MRRINNVRRNRANRNLRFENLEFRRLLVSNLHECSSQFPLGNGLGQHPLPWIEESSAPEGEDVENVENETTQAEPPFVAPVETLGPDDIFPILVFPPPFEEEIGDDWELENRFSAGGGVQQFGEGANNLTPTSGNTGGTTGGGNTGGGGTGGGGQTEAPILISVRNDFFGFEGDTPQFQVVASAPVPFAITVGLAYTPTGNGATAGSDYIPTTSITIPAFSSFCWG